MHKVYLMDGTGGRKLLTAVRNDRKPGDVMESRAWPEPLRAMRHEDRAILVLPLSSVPGDETCDGCVDGQKPSKGTLGPHCLECRRQYVPWSSAFENKGDFYQPGNT